MNKVVLITGASSGMGKIVAKELVKDGNIVYGVARNLKNLEKLEKLGVIIDEVDITNFESNTKIINRIIKEQGRIDVLFNNAGYGLYGAVEDVPIEQGLDQFNVNFFGLADLTKKVIPHMRKRESGLIINNSSMGGKIYTPLGSWYHATKHAIEGFSDCLRLELKEFGIHVVILEPGAIKTNWSAIALEKAKNSSSSTVYSSIYDNMVSGYKKAYEKGSDVEIIGKAVLKIVNSKKPKTRYAIGYMSKLSIFGRRILSDKMFDRIIMFVIK